MAEGLWPATGNNGKRKYHRMMGTLIPARVVGEPTIQRIEGRLTQVVNLITFNTTQDGTRTYLREQTVATRWVKGEAMGDGSYAEQRLQHCVALDGEIGTIKPISELVREVNKSEDEYQATISGVATGVDLESLKAKLQALQK